MENGESPNIINIMHNILIMFTFKLMVVSTRVILSTFSNFYRSYYYNARKIKKTESSPRRVTWPKKVRMRVWTMEDNSCFIRSSYRIET